ncbi:hypothetical protein FSP39_013547 [Pinctada imbricata]|uniref:EGF-like domain-containing protein n=1 Tax=Pinctada imbricata TaxID=66713 RepID=A0AA89BZ40_PINIB|nr:hypothetical protein FSP39_013547 [Pinctada imbricata]
MVRVNIENVTFELQARTDLATNGNGTQINATIFSAFAARDHTGSSIQVELTESKSSMIIYGNGVDQTFKFYHDTSFFVLSDNLTLSRENKTIVASFLKSGSVNSSTSLFKYPIGKSHSDFAHPSFVPFYVDEFPEEDQQEAKTTCGGNTASQACIFDYLATRDSALASESGATDSLAGELKVVIANRVPEITGDQSVHARIGQASHLYFNASDDKGYRFLVLSSPSSGFTFNNITGHVQWIPDGTEITSISITAVDESSLQASPIDVWIVLCSGCSGNGECDFNQTIATSNPTFSFARCICKIGWSGMNCSEDTDSCIGNPCISGSNCTDLTPGEEANLGRGHNCSSCPAGYIEKGNKCEDIDECKLNTCDHKCSDTEGSFICSCHPGYKLAGDKTSCEACDIPYYGENCTSICQCGHGSDTCDPVHGCLCNTGWTGDDCDEDEDECSLIPSVCQADQICSNLAGSFQCSCTDGFIMINGSCADVDECKDESQHNCSNLVSTCQNNIGGFSCTCNSGYQQISPYACTDVDECSTGFHQCSQICENVEGTYNCDCEFGYSLEEDRQTCTQDVDECSSPNICEQFCENTDGSYRCQCQDGFLLYENTKCKGNSDIVIEITICFYIKNMEIELKEG